MNHAIRLFLLVPTILIPFAIAQAQKGSANSNPITPCNHELSASSDSLSQLDNMARTTLTIENIPPSEQCDPESGKPNETAEITGSDLCDYSNSVAYLKLKTKLNSFPGTARLRIRFYNPHEARFFMKQLTKKNFPYNIAVSYSYIPVFLSTKTKNVWLVDKRTGKQQTLRHYLDSAQNEGLIEQIPPQKFEYADVRTLHDISDSLIITAPSGTPYRLTFNTSAEAAFIEQALRNRGRYELYAIAPTKLLDAENVFIKDKQSGALMPIRTFLDQQTTNTALAKKSS